MRRTVGFLSAALLMIAAAATVTVASTASIKVPKCSKRLCQDVGCAADFYCSSGATIKSCAEICGN